MCQNRGQAEREASHASADAQAGVPVAQVRSHEGETGGRLKSHGVSREVSGQTHHALVITWQEEERGRTHNINKPWESVQQGKSGGRGEGPAGTGACTSRGGTGQVSGACGGGDGDRGNKGEGQAGEQTRTCVPDSGKRNGPQTCGSDAREKPNSKSQLHRDSDGHAELGLLRDAALSEKVPQVCTVMNTADTEPGKGLNRN